MNSLGNNEVGTFYSDTYTEWRYRQKRNCTICHQRGTHEISYKWYIDDYKRFDFICLSCTSHKVAEQDKNNRFVRYFILSSS